jgi:hypothetical protein
MNRACKFLLLLYPREHRDQFAEEMIHVFEEASWERRAQGLGWYIRFAFGEMNGLIAGAADAWFNRGHAPSAPEQTPPGDLAEAQRLVEVNIAGMVHAIANHQFEKARLFSYQERQAREKLRMLRQKYNDEYGMPC